MYSRKAILIAAAAALGLGGMPAAQQQAAHNQTRAVAIANGTTQQAIRSDIFGGYLDGIAEQFNRQAGMNPAQFGQTSECRHMMRRSKLARLGIGRRRS